LSLGPIWSIFQNSNIEILRNRYLHQNGQILAFKVAFFVPFDTISYTIKDKVIIEEFVHVTKFVS